jgi:hypothetical protein
VTPSAALTFAWLTTPFFSGALIGRSPRAREVIAGHLPLSLTLGWTGVVMLIWGATALTSPAGLAAFALGGPLAGLSFWTYDDSGGSDDGGGGTEPPDDPLLPGPEWDWAEFARELERYSAGLTPREGTARTRPRRPASPPRVPAR